MGVASFLVLFGKYLFTISRVGTYLCIPPYQTSAQPDLMWLTCLVPIRLETAPACSTSAGLDFYVATT